MNLQNKWALLWAACVAQEPSITAEFQTHHNSKAITPSSMDLLEPRSPQIHTVVPATVLRHYWSVLWTGCLTQSPHLTASTSSHTLPFLSLPSNLQSLNELRLDSGLYKYLQLISIISTLEQWCLQPVNQWIQLTSACGFSRLETEGVTVECPRMRVISPVSPYLSSCCRAGSGSWREVCIAGGFGVGSMTWEVRGRVHGLCSNGLGGNVIRCLLGCILIYK